MPDGWVYQGARTEQLAEVELDVTSLARKIRESLGGEAGSPASDSSATRIGRVPAS